MIPKPLLSQIKKHIVANGIRSRTLIGYDEPGGFAWVVDIDAQGRLSRKNIFYMSREEYDRRQAKLCSMAGAGVIESQPFGGVLH